MPKTMQCQDPNMIPFTTYDEYKDKYKNVFLLDRTESGVVTAKFHTNGESAFWNYPIHRGIHQLCHDVGQDAESEVLILGGTGDAWLRLGKTSIEETFENQKWALYEHSYYDGCNMVESIVNDVEQPTIGVINGKGPVVHAEIALLCDITIMSEDAYILEGHFSMANTLNGDGVQIALRALMPLKQANYTMPMGKTLSAQEALRLGLVSEVVPADKVYERALEIGEYLAAKPRTARRLMAQTLRMPLKEQIAKELRTTFGTEMWNMMSAHTTHDEEFAKFNKQQSGN